MCAPFWPPHSHPCHQQPPSILAWWASYPLASFFLPSFSLSFFAFCFYLDGYVVIDNHQLLKKPFSLSKVAHLVQERNPLSVFLSRRAHSVHTPHPSVKCDEGCILHMHPASSKLPIRVMQAFFLFVVASSRVFIDSLCNTMCTNSE